jgi:TPR repeat protein
MKLKRLALVIALIGGAAAAEPAESELSYARFAEEHDPSHPLFCMYGYFASKTGDHATAHAIFERCRAEAQNGAALVWLSLFYEEGLGVTANPEQAEALMREAAENGYSVAQYNLGKALLAKAETPEAAEAARGWLRRAADQGDADAAALLDGS